MINLIALPNLTNLTLSDNIRIYYEDDYFDEGEIRTIDGDEITVDFYDWIERFDIKQLRKKYPLPNLEVIETSSRGKIIKDFRKCSKKATR